MSTIAGKYKIVEKLGSGAYGDVYLVLDSENNKLAAKRVSLDNYPMMEIDLLSRLQSPYIIKATDIVYVNRGLYIIMPNGTPLDKLLGTLSKRDRVKAIFEIAQGIMYLKKLNVVHCDTKPDNILYSEGRFMLIDLGVARYNSIGSTVMCQSEAYSSPEVMSIRGAKSSSYTGKVDLTKSEIWSFGMLCIDIIYNKRYISTTLSLERLMGRRTKQYIISQLGIPFDMDLLDMVVNNLLVPDPEARSPIEDLIRSSYFKSNNMIPSEIELPVDKWSDVRIDNMEYFKPTFLWLLKSMSMLRCPSKCAFMVIDNFLYFWRIYMLEEYDHDRSIDLASTVMVITYMVCDLFNPASYIKSPLQSRDTTDASIRLLLENKGVISRLSLYDSLDTLDMLIVAVEMLLEDQYINIPRADLIVAILERCNGVRPKEVDKDSLTFDYIYSYIFIPPKIYDIELSRPHMESDENLFDNIIKDGNIHRLHNYLSRGLGDDVNPVSYKTHIKTSYRSTIDYIRELLRVWNRTVYCASLIDEYIDTKATLKIKSDPNVELYYVTVKIHTGGYTSKMRELTIFEENELDEILRAMYSTGYISDRRSRIL